MSDQSLCPIPLLNKSMKRERTVNKFLLRFFVSMCNAVHAKCNEKLTLQYAVII